MHLRRIEIRDFRKIGHKVIDGLDDGLNVIVGDNEAGKSTLLDALRTVFFERHTLSGETAREMMLPYGATVRPEISVAFEIDGQPWRLRKAFLQKPEAELVGPGGQRVIGTAVEERLADLLGFVQPGRGLSKPDEHHGTHALLWVQQGPRDTLGVGAGRDTLAAALEREVGQVTGGDRGRALLAAAERRRDLFWSKTERPRGTFKDLRDEIERLEGEMAALRHRQGEHDAKVARLTALSDMLSRHERDDRLAKAVAAVTTAQTALAAAQGHEGTLAEAVRARTEAERDAGLAEERRKQRKELVGRVEAARTVAAEADDTALEAGRLARHQSAQVAGLASAAITARTTAQTVETHLRAVQDSLAYQRATAALARQQAQFDLAERQDRDRRAAVARAEARPIERDTLAMLTKLERAAETARAELAAAGVQITFEPDGSRLVTVDGVAQDTTTGFTLTHDAVLTLEGFGRLGVRPGGGTGTLARKSTAAGDALATALAGARFASVAEAATAAEVRANALAEARSLGESVAALAPKGVDALRQALETERTRLALPLSAEAAALAGTADQAGLDAARQAAAAARATSQRCEAEERAAADGSQTALLADTRAAERSAGARRQLQAAADELAAARSTLDDDLLDRRCAACVARVAEALAGENTARSALDAADLDAARTGLDRALTAERTIRADIAALDREKRDLQAELRGVGHEGIGERLAELDGVLEGKRRDLAARDLEARASRLLHETLRAAQSEAKDRWLAPVRTRISPYLRLLDPDSEIALNEHTLEIEGLSRRGQTETFGALSMGAREQVAVITRLALADVLRAAGHPATVILDDALVNTDETRLDRMHNVLTRAARTLQILILTCRERDFVGLGAVHRM